MQGAKGVHLLRSSPDNSSPKPRCSSWKAETIPPGPSILFRSPRIPLITHTLASGACFIKLSRPVQRSIYCGRTCTIHGYETPRTGPSRLVGIERYLGHPPSRIFREALQSFYVTGLLGRSRRTPPCLLQISTPRYTPRDPCPPFQDSHKPLLLFLREALLHYRYPQWLSQGKRQFLFEVPLAVLDHVRPLVAVSVVRWLISFKFPSSLNHPPMDNG